MELWISVLVTFALLFLGQKVYASFLMGSIVYILIKGTGQATMAPLIAFSLDSVSLLAVPLYMLSGELMERSSIADRLIDFANVLLRKVKYGLGSVIPLASMFFGALCGSGAATAAAMSSIMVPKMERLGWDKRYVAAMLTASAPLGFMIPPNMSAIIYALVSGASVADLFMATIIPGVIWGALYMVINRVYAKKWVKSPAKPIAFEKKNNVSADEIQERFNTGVYSKDLLNSFKYAIPAFVLPIIIMGGIYGGVCSPTEAGAIACVYALIMGFAIKKINIKSAFSAFVGSGRSLGSIFLITPMCLLLSRYMLFEGAPQAMATFITSITTNKIAILLMMNVLFFVCGMFFDANVLTLVLTPLLLPTARAIGLDFVQMGVILFVSLGIGAMTPPMAQNLFIATTTAGVSIKDTIKPLLVFLFFAAIPILLLVTFVPQISLWLPSHMH